MSTKLSIIVPCYNCAQTLEEAISSIYQQNLVGQFEVVLVNDASTDDTQKIIENLAQKYPHIHYHQHEENLGGGAARNTAVAKSTGNIIFCLDGDDILPPAVLPKMLKMLEDKKSDGIVFSGSRSFQKDIDKYKYIDFQLGSEPMTLKYIFAGQSWGVGANFLYTKEAYLKAGGYPTNHNFDTQGFGLRFLSAGLIAYSCPGTFFYQRQFTGNYSYYERAYNAGEISIGNYLMMMDVLHLFTPQIRQIILSFDLFTKTLSNRNLLSTLTAEYRRDPQKFFIPNYQELLIPNSRNVYLKNLVNLNERTDKFISIIEQGEKAKEKQLAALALYLKKFPEDYNAYYNIFLTLVEVQGLSNRPADIQNFLKSFILEKKTTSLKRPTLATRALVKLLKMIKKQKINSLKFKTEHLIRIVIKNPGRILRSLKNKFKAKKELNQRYSTNHEVMALIKYIRKAKIGIVEIGVLDAGTTRELALYTKVPMYGLDPLIGDSMDEKLIGSKEVIKKNMSFYSNYHFFQDFSYNLIKEWDYPFDFIWIDGDHTYEGVKKDFSDWSPKLAPSGIIAFHDSAPVTSEPNCPHRGYDGPIKLVSELKQDPNLKFLRVADSISFFQKI